MLDLIIRGGEVVDGTGAPRSQQDIGIRDGRIVEVGKLKGEAKRELDAQGLIVTPGFLDIHTHYDVQVFWDPLLTPSSLHGITTVVVGNCGFSTAPINDSSRDFVRHMLARVEGMPLEALEEVTWNWGSTAEYLDQLEGNSSVNIAALVGHSAIRRIIMGAAASERSATADEVDAMCSLLREGLAAGGVGFSTSDGLAHHDWDGVPVPSRSAAREEFLALAAVVGQFEGTTIGFNPRDNVQLDEDQRELMAAMASVANRPVNWNTMRVNQSNLEARIAQLDPNGQHREGGGGVVALTMPTHSRARYSFRTGLVLDVLPGWHETMALPIDDRVKALMDPEVRRRLENGSRKASQGFSLLADWAKKTIMETKNPNLRSYVGRTVEEIAATEGKQPFEALLDIVCADDLNATFSNIVPMPTFADWQAAVTLWRDGRAIIGGSDAGAHLDFSASFDYTLYILAHAVREHHALTLEEAVHLMTAVPAQYIGVRDRGCIRENAWADLVVFDENVVGPGELHTRADMPGGASRLYADPKGVNHVLVNGVPIVGPHADSTKRPGQVLRASGR